MAVDGWFVHRTLQHGVHADAQDGPDLHSEVGLQFTLNFYSLLRTIAFCLSRTPAEQTTKQIA